MPVAAWECRRLGGGSTLVVEPPEPRSGTLVAASGFSSQLSRSAFPSVRHYGDTFAAVATAAILRVPRAYAVFVPRFPKGFAVAGN